MISFSLPRKHAPDISLLVQVQNQPHGYLVDCGALRDYSVRQLQRVRAVFVSHTHVDHWIDFDRLVRHQVQDDIEVLVCGPRGIGDRVSAKLRAYNWNLLDARAARYRVREITEPGRVEEYLLRPPHYQPGTPSTHTGALFTDAGVRVEYALLDHRIPSVAYCFVTPDRLQLRLAGTDYRGGPWAAALKAAYRQNRPDTPLRIDDTHHRAGDLFHLLHELPGMRAGVVLDHAIGAANRSAIRTLFRGADTVYIESYFLQKDRELALRKAHSTAVESARTLSGIGVKHAHPIHHSRKYSEAEVATLHREFYTAFRS